MQASWQRRVVAFALLQVFALATLPASMAGLKKKIQGIPSLTDLALFQEIQATDLKLAQLGVSAQYLAMTRPAPTYTLTGGSFYTGTFWHYGNTGHFTFQGQSIYQLTPNYGAELGYAIGQAIVATQINRSLRYRTALLNEVVSRAARRDAESRTTVDNFYEHHPDLRGHESLVACIAPWVEVENQGLTTPDLLNAIASRTRALMAAPNEDAAGEWFGIMVQENRYPDGSKSPFWLFIRSRMTQDGGTISGVYNLIDGSNGAIHGTIAGTKLTGNVVNNTYGLGFEISGDIEAESLHW